MTDFEKLIELFDKEECPVTFLDRRDQRAFAEHLLANGVIVLPCNVGDTVYFVYCGKIFPHTIKRFEIDKHGNFAFSSFPFTFKDFGKTVFLTREEAEKALAERKEKQ